jgi:hypothetical protein
MLGEILPDLVLLAIVLAFILSSDARLTAAGRALGLVTASQRSQRIAAIMGSRQRLSRASALATPAEHATTVESASPTPEEMHHDQP